MRASWLVGLGRGLLLLAAAAAAVSAFLVTRRHDHLTVESGVRYVCPMHPEVQTGAPANCPICGMALRKVAVDRGVAASRPAGEEPLLAADLISARAEAAIPPRYSTDIVRRHTLRQELHAPAWVGPDGLVEALLYQDELPSLTAGERASFVPAGAPTVAVDVHAAPGAATPWDGSTSIARFEVDGRGAALRSGSAGWVKLARKPREILAVPSWAVLQSAEGPYVLVLSADGRGFNRRLIEIGKVFSGFTAVVAGVKPGEQVASINAFFVDAERRLRAERRGAVP